MGELPMDSGFGQRRHSLPRPAPFPGFRGALAAGWGKTWGRHEEVTSSVWFVAYKHGDMFFCSQEWGETLKSPTQVEIYPLQLRWLISIFTMKRVFSQETHPLVPPLEFQGSPASGHCGHPSPPTHPPTLPCARKPKACCRCPRGPADGHLYLDSDAQEPEAGEMIVRVLSF